MYGVANLLFKLRPYWVGFLRPYRPSDHQSQYLMEKEMRNRRYHDLPDLSMGIRTIKFGRLPRAMKPLALK